MPSDMIEQTIDEWRAEARERFGDRARHWRFQCPLCGFVASAEEFVEFGGDVDGATKMCLGRLPNVISRGGLEGPAGAAPCNWAAFGLFGTLGKGRKVTLPPEDEYPGSVVEVFDFAPTGARPYEVLKFIRDAEAALCLT